MFIVMMCRVAVPSLVCVCVCVRRRRWAVRHVFFCFVLMGLSGAHLVVFEKRRCSQRRALGAKKLGCAQIWATGRSERREELWAKRNGSVHLAHLPNRLVTIIAGAISFHGVGLCNHNLKLLNLLG